MKNTKSVLTIILAMVIITSVFAACSAKTDETSAEDTSSEITTVSTTIESITEQPYYTTAADTEDNESDEASSSNSGGSDSADSNSGNSKTTTKKTTITTKKTTTTQKNVSAKEVQNEVNNYIKSKGITLDSSMTPSNASWSGQIAGTQEDLNNGYSLKTCKSYADLDISDYKSSNGCNPLAMYCYYDGSDFYILYW